MQVVSVAEARKGLKSLIDSVVFDNETVVIHRRAKESVAVISLSEFNALKETEYLLGNRANADRLAEGIRQIQAGRGVKRELAE
ncbi:hypothetical protein AGMMS50229_14510 [Campylobacterota bacterium]|nr:hypothetical protein AGMMS50229_14510 [Campylobacterota bacterium]